MDNKFLGWIAFEATTPCYIVMEDIAEFQNELAAEGYVSYMTCTTADEEISEDLGIIFSTEPITDEEAKEAFEEFLREDLDLDDED